MSAALGLDPLLTALREAGLTVGVSEVARLQRVFALGPQISAPEDYRLKAVLRAVIVKSAEDRARFESVFDAWLGQADLEVSLREAATTSPVLAPVPSPPPKPKSPAGRWVALMTMVVAILIPLGYTLFRRQSTVPPKTISAITPKPAPDEPTPPQASTPAEVRNSTFTTWVPTLAVTPGKPVWQGWPALTLGILALLATSSLWLVQRQRSGLPEPAPEPVKKGPPRVFLSPAKVAGPQLLETREREALVWGIGHFMADVPTRRLDLLATVRATARDAGVPHLIFHQARHPREVWLWTDEAADDPAISRLADELEATLRAHGLPIERALFRGVPDWLVNSAGQAFAPNEVDERRDAALVAILTDGRILARQYAADDRRLKLDALLRSLSRWPRLAFVDFAADLGELAPILEKHALSRINPPELTAFLSNDEVAQRKAVTAGTTGLAWAAVCALAPSSIDEVRALEIRRRLGLATSPWALRSLRAEAPGPPGRLQWQPQVRARRVNWLRDSEAQPANRVAPGSLLAKALDFWEEVYDGELSERSVRIEDGDWLETQAHQHLRMERALLTLWREAPNAIRDLYRLHRGAALRELIERHLSQMSPLDWGGPDHLHLPWTWAERSAAEQVMLQAMMLGGGVPAATLRRPGRLFLGLGLSLGLAAGALTAAALSGRRPLDGPPNVVHGPGKPADASQAITESSAGRWRVTIATAQSQATQDAPAGSLVEVRWEAKNLLCRNGELLKEHGMTFVHICPGTFTMGSTDAESQALSNERPAHSVSLSEFWIGQTEVTNAQYRDNGKGLQKKDTLPAIDMTWHDAEGFCNRRGWRLPTEAEWEYAARAGTQTPWSFGNDEEHVGDFSWFEGNSGFELHPVGTKNPNPWGLYDMHGNAWEWVEDWYGLYRPSPQRDPTGPETGKFRSVRGGAFDVSPWVLRSSFRVRDQSTIRGGGIGFRCARSPRR